MMAVFLFLLITLYIACKNYKDKKYFSKEWEKQYGRSGHLDPDPEAGAAPANNARYDSSQALNQNRDSVINQTDLTQARLNPQDIASDKPIPS